MGTAYVVAALLGAFLSAQPGLAGFSWTTVTDQSNLQHGDGTFYGQQGGQDDQGACSFSKNFANTNSMPWSSGSNHTLALNDAMFDGSNGCGLCVKYRGTGAGIGTTPLSTTHWYTGFVNNRCPECAFGSLDINANGDGRWKVEWYAVPCPVGESTIRYDIVVSSYYWFSMVVSNTRVPIASVEIKLQGQWLPLKRTVNNQWPYYNTNGPWQSAFPVPIRVTSATGETIEDTITGVKGNQGTKQFSGAAGSDSTQVGSGSDTSSSTAPSPAPASSEGSSPPPAAAPTPSDGKMYIIDWGQCGGNALQCGAGAPTLCIAAPWPTAVCKSSGWTCNRYDDGLYQCQPPKTPTGNSNTNYAAMSVGGRRLLLSS